MTKTTDLMGKFMESRHAEGELDSAVAEAFGGEEWWRPGAAGLPFDDWSYDWYDSSVELLGCSKGFCPSADALAALLVVGICRVYVSYQGVPADTYGTPEEPAAWVWYVGEGEWKNGRCSARVVREHKTGLIRDLKQQIVELEARERQLLERIESIIAREASSGE